MSAAAAIAKLDPRDTVVMGHCEPPALVEAIADQRERLQGMQLIVWPLEPGSAYLKPESNGHFDIVAANGLPFRQIRKNAHGWGDRAPDGPPFPLDYLPSHASRLADTVSKRVRGRLVVLLHVADADQDGAYSTGLSCDYTASLIESADLVVAEVNRQMPSMPGPNSVPGASIDLVVATDLPLTFASRSRLPTEEDVAIGEVVAGLVPNGATIEVGVGGGGAAIWNALSGHKDLGIHSGVIGREAVDLMKSGVVTNRLKGRNSMKSVTACIAGDSEFVSSLHSVENLEVWPTSYTHSLSNLAALNRFVAINACLQVDLFGQVYSENVRGRMLGATGGQVDFSRGAAASPGGVAISVLRSCVPGRDASAIVSPSSAPGAVSLTHTDVQVIVTEYGAADLRGLTLLERGLEIAKVANPRYRSTLRQEALRLRSV